MNNINIKDLFYNLQEQMETTLRTNRSVIMHPTSKGDALEDVWINWLRKYLPNRYNVDKAIVIDSQGGMSEQIDLVIYDQQYTPFIFTQNQTNYIPAEGVYAVFEVKPDLKGACKYEGSSISFIHYAAKKIESVRRLVRTSTTIIDRGQSRSARPLTKIVGGILTNTNTIAKEDTVREQLVTASRLGSLDMGCSMDTGSFFVDYERKEDESIKEFNARIRDYYSGRTMTKLDFSSKEESLISFFLQLSRYLQQSIGTVAAIDLGEYAKAIDFSIDKEI
jgi:hypothetical protein